MNDNPTVSAIISTFNGLRRGFLHMALESIMRQTHSVDEVILVDDGSTDGTSDYVSEHFPNIKIIRKANRGLPAARNTGVLAASSDLIAFIDDDDIWEARKIEVQLQLISTRGISRELAVITAPYKALVSSHNKLAWRLDKLCEPCKPWLTWPGCILGNGVSSPSGVMLPRRLIIEAGGFDSSLSIGEDYEFWMRLCALGASFYSCDMPLVQYRIHSAQMSGNIEKVLTTIWALHKRYLELLPDGYQARVVSAIFGSYLQIALRNKLWGTIHKFHTVSKESGWTKNWSYYVWISFFLVVDVIRGIFTVLGCSRISTFIRTGVVALCFGGYKDLPKSFSQLRPNFMAKS